MKTVALLLAFISVASRLPATLPGPFVTAEGQMMGDRYELWFDYFEHVSTKWNPERDEWPLSTKDAVLAGRGGLTKMVGPAAELFEVREVRMHRYWTPAGEEKATFYFVVFFESMKEAAGARKVGPGTAPAVLPFIVYPEGYVKAPTKKAPNKAPEPTPTAVMPAAEQPSRRP